MDTQRLHQHKTHPWVDDFGHAIAVAVSRRVARDIVRNARWGVGNDGQPVYDVSGEDGGYYLGDVGDDSVRCRIGGPIIMVWHRTEVTETEATEAVYRLMLPRARRWLNSPHEV